MKHLIPRVGLAVLVGTFPPACAEERPTSPQTAAARTGTLGLALETVSASGKVYRLRQAVLPIDALAAAGSVHQELRSEDDPDKSVLETLIVPGTYQITLNDGWFVEQVDRTLGTSIFVPAQLQSPQTQVFDIEPDGETFVKFDFEVDGGRVSFGDPGRFLIGIGIQEREAAPPPTGPNPRRSLIETNRDAVAAFSLPEVFAAIQSNAGLLTDPLLMYQQLIDNYSSAPFGRLPGSAHCGDESTNGAPSLNGFPLRCDRLEASQFDNLSQWFPTAVINRIDLAPADGAHCGQQRLIFANNAFVGNGRMFMILEAQLPNPHPECGIEACRPLAEFWSSLTDVADPATRGARLREAFVTGSPALLSAGFQPFLNVANMSVGSGTIRTNNFNDSPWTLREFKVLADPLGQTRVVQFPVKDAPHGELWNDTSPLSVGAACRQSFLDAVGGLLSSDPAELAFVVNEACLDAESPNDGFSQDYAFHLSQGSGAFQTELEARLLGTGLSATDLAQRARFAGSCMGCHAEANGASLGNGVFAPFSNDFVHVSEQRQEDCGDGTLCFALSPALQNVFLPRRLRVVTDLVAITPTCGQPQAPDGGVPGDAGAPVPPPPPPPGVDGGAPATDLAVLTPDETLQDLVDQDQAARDALLGDTLGGQPAAVTH